ncbi:hypothetical protein D3C75_949850 [compost metagenome]
MQEPIAIFKDQAGIRSKEVRFEKKEIPYIDMLKDSELEELYIDLLVREHYKSLSKAYSYGTRAPQGKEAPKISVEDSTRQRVQNDPNSKQKAKEAMGKLEENELRSLYLTKYVKEGQTKEKSKEERLE